MLNLIATFHVFSSALKQRVHAVYSERERGSVTLEQVVITLALLIAAVALVAVITNAITSRSAQITDG